MTEASDPIIGTGIDTAVPHSARIWNYWLGGKDNYAVDREATGYLHADMHDSEALIEGATEILDFTQPVAVQFIGVLGHIAALEEARTLVTGLMDRVPSGSYLTICDGTHSAESTATQQAQDEYASTGAAPYLNRAPEEIASLFDGMEWVDPGFVSVPLWRPERPEGVTALNDKPPTPIDEFGGMGRKP